MDALTNDNNDKTINNNLKLKPVWYDEDDEDIDVAHALKLQKRKLPNGGVNNRKAKYSKLLKEKFKSIVGTPTWSELKTNNKSQSTSVSPILCSNELFNSSDSKAALPSSTLDFKKVFNLNGALRNEGPLISSVVFHPSSSVGVVTGNSGILNLYSVDGKNNSKLHSVAFEKYPILNARLIENGNKVILGSNYSYLYTFDLMTTKYIKYNLPTDLTQCKQFIVHPDIDCFAVAGKWGHIHLLSTVSKESIFTFKQDGTVTGLTFSSDGNNLFSHSDTGVISVWDLQMRKIKHTFSDESCISGTSITASSSNQFLATGSAHGIVNLYNMSDVMISKNPKPIKTIYNLRTSISNLAFNPSSEILSISSSYIQNSIKLFHLGSKSVFSNFPTYNCQLGQITCVAFSPRGGYFAHGNKQNTVSLYHLKHFKNY